MPKFAGANVVGRIRFALERWDSPHHRSHVAQLGSLGCLRYMRILPLMLILIALALAGCATDPKAALAVRQTGTNLDFEISTEHVNGLLGLRVWQADAKEVFWDIALRYYREPRLAYGVVPTDFKTFGGGTSSAEQKFPASGQRPRALPSSTTFLTSIYFQYDTMFDAKVREVYFSFATDAEGKVLSVIPVARVAPEDYPKTP